MVARPPKQVQALDIEDLTAYNIIFDDEGQVQNIQRMENPYLKMGQPNTLELPENETRVLMDMQNSDPDTVRLLTYTLEFKGKGQKPEVTVGTMSDAELEQFKARYVQAQEDLAMGRDPNASAPPSGGRRIPVRNGAGGSGNVPVQSQPKPQRPNFKIKDHMFNKMVSDFCVDLTEKFKNRIENGDDSDPVLERDSERKKVVRALLHRDRANAAVLGEPGVGKTVMFDALAYDVVTGADHVPEKMRTAQVINVDIQAMNAGASRVTNEFEQRLKAILEGAEERNRAFFETGYGHPVILCIDEFHQIMDPRIGAADLLKPHLSRGDGLQVAIATTADEYDKHISKDPALDRRFYSIMVEEPNAETTFEIANGGIAKYEKHHQVKYSEDLVKRAIELTNRYMRERFQPAKAIDALDAAGAIAHQNGEAKVTEQHLIKAVADAAKLDPEFLGQGEEERILKLEEKLPQWVQGQDHAIAAIPPAIMEAKSGLNDPNRPYASFLLRGPTGVGKTETAKALAKLLFGSESKLLTIDMGEYAEKHDAKRFTGAPPSYIGHGEKTALSDLRKDPMQVVLFDEIEKAHPDVYKVLLGILDEGRIKTGDNKVIDFKNSVVLMTTNLGAKEAEFARQGGAHSRSNDVDEEAAEKAAEQAYDRAWKSGNFPPEFRGRVDAVLTYRALSKQVVNSLLQRRIDTISERMRSKYPMLQGLELTPEALKELEGKSFTPDKGARGMNQAVKTYLSQPLGKKLLEMKVAGQEITEPSTLVVSGLGEEFAFKARPIKPANENKKDEKLAATAKNRKKAASPGSP